jgi:hypothetical protein
MYGDFSRLTFDRVKSYTAAWSQQGRVQLDADLNEQTAILLDWMRTLAVDFIGPAGGHIDRAGFEVGQHDGTLTVGIGHYYVAGLRCQAPPPGLGVAAGSHIYTPKQPDIPKTPPYLVYLRVWERSINCLQDAALLEPALGPGSPDTTIRTQVAWSLATTDSPGAAPDKLSAAVADQFDAMNSPPPPLLQARLLTTDDGAGGYSGLENQLYRVEVHDGNEADPTATATFKWSRDNGSAEYGIDHCDVDTNNDRTTVYLTGTALPGRPKLEIGDAVEVIDAAWEPFGPADGPLCEVIAVDHIAQTVTLAGAPGPTMTTPVLLRRWDSGPQVLDISPIGPGADDAGWTPVESRIQVRFITPTSPDARYRRGDFWLIPARATTGQIYGPTVASGGAPPHGPDRHYAPLALIDGSGVHDQRSLFTYLAWPDTEAPA